MSIPVPAKLVCDHIEKLPTELIQKVLLYLDRKSLSNFSYASRNSRSFAMKYIFETVCININLYGGTSTMYLARDICQWNSILIKYDAFNFVRYLRLGDGDFLRPRSLDRVPRLRMNPYNLEAFRQDPGELSIWTETWVERMQEPGLPWDTYAGQFQRLKELVSMFSNLESVYYGFGGNMALRVIRCLQQIRPSEPKICFDQDILHLRHLNFSDPLMLADTIRPWFTSFKLRFDNPDDVGALNAVLLNSPQLKRIQLWWNVLLADDAAARLEFTRLPEGFEGHPRLSLTEFHVRQDTGLWETTLQYWSNRIDFRQLTVLKLEGPCIIDALTWFADNIEDGLPKIQALTLNTWKTVDTPGQYHVPLTRFFRCLKGLSKLRLKGEITAACIRAALKYHGKTLRQLWLENNENSKGFVFNWSLIKKLRKKCKVLEDLVIPLKRSKGDPEEAQILRHLGSISTLRKIDLSLDISKTCDGKRFTRQRDDPPYSDFHQQLLKVDDPIFEPIYIPYGRLRDLFWNAAIDHNLVLQIFEIISGGKESGAPPIEIIIVRPNGISRVASALPHSNLGALLQDLGQTWLVERDSRDAHREDLRLTQMHDIVPYNDSLWFTTTIDLDSRLKDVFRKLWPGVNYDNGEVLFWLDQWTSFAIDTSKLQERTPVKREIKTFHQNRRGGVARK